MVIFNGPLRLNIFLLKSDIKVNKYVIEYKWLTGKVSERVRTFIYFYSMYIIILHLKLKKLKHVLTVVLI